MAPPAAAIRHEAVAADMCMGATSTAMSSVDKRTMAARIGASACVGGGGGQCRVTQRREQLRWVISA
jgi:hypothetical protein